MSAGTITDQLPAVAAHAAPAPRYAIDHDAVLKCLGIDPRAPASQALLLTCERYGLDPVLKHAMLIQGRLYVTRDGLLHVAHRDGRLDGIVVEDQGETASHWTARVAVYRKDMSHPFTYVGRYPKSGHQKAYGPEMAVKTAEVMSLRRAFDIGLCAREEAWEAEPLDAPAGKDAGYDPEPAPRTSTNDPAGSPAGDRSYKEWAADYCRKVNEAWTARHAGLDADRELVRPDQMHRHLYKVLMGVESTAGVIYNHLIRALGIAFAESPAAVKQAARHYVSRLAEEAEDGAEGRAPAPSAEADEPGPDAPDGEPFDPTTEPGHDDR